MNTPQHAPVRIVILGGGFGGAYCTQAIEKAIRRRPDVEVLLIDRHNYFVFTPLLVEAGTGSIEPRHAVVPIRGFIRRTKFIMAEVTGIQLDRDTIQYRFAGSSEIESLKYDHLVFALGSITMLPPIDNLREYGWPLKNLPDAVAMRDRVIQLLEQAENTSDAGLRRELLHLVVVGGSYTGVEVAGEFDQFLKRMRRHYRNIGQDEARLTLVEMRDRILPAVDEDLARYAAGQLKRRGIDIRLETTIKEMGADYVLLSSGERLPTRTVIWCAGIAPHPLVKKSAFPTDDKGYILCDPEMRVKGYENVWAIGDVAVNPDPHGGFYPATAQHATRLGVALAENLRRVLDGQSPRPARLRNLGSLAPLGCRTAVAKVLGVKLSGFLAWFIWRTVYLWKMPGFGRSLRVAIDWTVDLLVRAEPVQMGLHRAESNQSDE